MLDNDPPPNTPVRITKSVGGLLPGTRGVLVARTTRKDFNEPDYASDRFRIRVGTTEYDVTRDQIERAP